MPASGAWSSARLARVEGVQALSQGVRRVSWDRWIHARTDGTLRAPMSDAGDKRPGSMGQASGWLLALGIAGSALR